MSNVVLGNPGRREFLRAVPAGAAAGFAIANASLFAPVGRCTSAECGWRGELSAFHSSSRFRMT